MPNPIKYTTGSETLALKKGNFYIGTGDVGKGPSDTTGYYQGPSPASGGYVVYLNKSGVPGNLSYHSAANDGELISFTNNLSGTSFTSATQCLNYYATQTDKVCFNRDYEGIVTNGLVLNLDAGFTPSYSRSGTTWYDVSSSNNGTLTNGPTFNSDNGGSIVFDGVDDYVVLPFTTNYSSFSVNFFFKLSGTKTYSYAISTGNGTANSSFQIEFNDPDAGNTARTLWIWWGSTSGFDGGLFVSSSGNTGNWNDNTWRHLVFTHTSTTNILYINGTIFNSYSTAGTQTITQMGGDNYNLSIGRRQENNGLFFQGNITNMIIYNRALSAEEVLQNYNAQKGRFGL
jgi:hypothetical protein